MSLHDFLTLPALIMFALGILLSMPIKSKLGSLKSTSGV